MNFELVEGSIKNRGKIVRSSDIDLTPTDQERYVSMFGFDNSIYEHIALNKSVSGYNGNYFARALWFDIDNTDLKKAKETATKFVQNLYNELCVRPSEVLIYFSGSKGFHIGLRAPLFGGFPHHKELPLKFEYLAKHIISDAMGYPIDKLMQASNNFESFDIGIYNANRIFRAANSKNKLGYKVQISAQQLYHNSIESIIEFAQTPQTIVPDVPNSHLAKNELLALLWNRAWQYVPIKPTKPSDKELKGLFKLPDFGERNNTFFKQAAALFDKSELGYENIYQILRNFNSALQNPIEEKELRTLIASAEKTVGKTMQARMSDTIVTLADAFEDYAEMHQRPSEGHTLLVNRIDQDQRFNLKSKCIALVGKGGSKKSLYALNVALYNCLSNESRIAYSTMEMSQNELVGRCLNMLCTNLFDEYGNIAQADSVISRYLSENAKTEAASTYISEIKQRIKSDVSDRVILSQRGQNTTNDYREWLNEIEKTSGKVDFLVVDGLSMMEVKGSENESFMRHSAELKALANERQMCIILICHVTKECPKFAKDCRAYIRGSEKILDNCDFSICFSQLIDMDSEDEEPRGVNDRICIDYWNKRGSGKQFTTVLAMDERTLQITATEESANNYPTLEEFNRRKSSYNAAKSKQQILY